MTVACAHLFVVLVFATAGCQDPYAEPGRREANQECTASPQPHGAAVAEGAARAFASRWVNWDWRTAGGQQRALARLATGRLAAQLLANARSARVDASLARDKAGSGGVIVAVDLSGAGPARSGVVVTREQTYTAGRADLGGRHHRVYRVRLSPTAGGWEVSAWQRLP